jgi:hypothetical protein
LGLGVKTNRRVEKTTLQGASCFVRLNKHCSGDQIKKTRIGRVSSTYGERSGAYRILVGKPEGMRSLGRHRRTQKDNIKMYLREVGWGHGLDQSGSG